MRSIRGKQIGMIFQEPMTSFSPLHTIGDQIMEAVLIHEKGATKKDARDRAIEMLSRVGIRKPAALDRLPIRTSTVVVCASAP